MRILIAPDKFKGSLTARQAADAMARGVQHAASELAHKIEVDVCPVSDGGEGFNEAITQQAGASEHRYTVTGPLGTPIECGWTRVDDRGYCSLAATSGFELVPPDRRDPGQRTTRGLGEMIAHMIEAGCRQIVVGLGGSSTCDGGIGMADAIGYRFLNETGAALKSVGDSMRAIARIERTEALPAFQHLEVLAACDVNNPLYGPNGAAHIFAPQKGATPEQVEQLDAGLRNLAQRCADAGLDAEPETPGAGAAGGMGFGLMAFLSAKVVRGAEVVLEVVNFRERARKADLILTGEGRLDAQSLAGKAPMAVAKAAAEFNVPTIALVGTAADDAWKTTDQNEGGWLSAYHVIGPEGASEDDRIARASEYLEQATARIILDRART